jgi:hypothetical protein
LYQHDSKGAPQPGLSERRAAQGESNGSARGWQMWEAAI